MVSLEEVLPTLMDSGIDVFVAAESSSLKDSGIDVCVAAERSSLKNIRTLLDQLDSASPEKPELDAPPPNLMDNFLFIFTSGTTGAVHTENTNSGYSITVF